MEKIITRKVVFAKTDGIEFPKLKTRKYFLSLKELKNVKGYVMESGFFGTLDEGLMGLHPVEFQAMNYTFNSRRGFIESLRTAVKENGEPLSHEYFFKKGEIPLNIFLLVKNPWINILREKKKDKYIVQAYARSPEKAILPKAISDLEKILDTFRID